MWVGSICQYRKTFALKISLSCSYFGLILRIYFNCRQLDVSLINEVCTKMDLLASFLLLKSRSGMVYFSSYTACKYLCKCGYLNKKLITIQIDGCLLK